MTNENECFINDSVATKNYKSSNCDTDNHDIFYDSRVTASPGVLNGGLSSAMRNTFNYLDSADISETASDDINPLTSSEINASCITSASQISAENNIAYYDDPD